MNIALATVSWASELNTWIVAHFLNEMGKGGPNRISNLAKSWLNRTASFYLGYQVIWLNEGLIDWLIALEDVEIFHSTRKEFFSKLIAWK